jgi:hypothetical protein
MKTCYRCKRNDDEVRKELLAINKEQFESEDKFVRLEMEEENKQVIDLEKEWEDIKQKASNSISDIFKVDLISVLNNQLSSTSLIPDFLKKAEMVFGNTMKTMNPMDIEREIRKKVEQIKNIPEYENRITKARDQYVEKEKQIANERNLIIERNLVVGNGIELKVPICIVCRN